MENIDNNDAYSWAHQAVIRNKDEFIGGSFEYDYQNGYEVKKGQLKKSPDGKLEIQSYLFYEGQFSEKQAKIFLKENGIKFKKFIPAKEISDNADCVYNYDVMEQTEDWLTEPFKKTEDGFGEALSIVTNVGVFTYRTEDGEIIRELRPPGEVFNPDSKETLKMIPLTDNHPEDLVTIDNIKELQIGMTGSNVLQDSYALSVPLKITDKKAVDNVVDNKKTALSCGYTAVLDFTPGVWMGVQYDAIQRKIRYNHVALVDRARAGDLAKIRKDSKDAIMINDSDVFGDSKKSKGVEIMADNLKKISLDGVEYQAEGEVIKALNSTKKDAEEVKKNLDASQEALKLKDTELSKLQAEHDILKGKLDEAEKKIEESKMSDEEIQTAVKERQAIVDNAKLADVKLEDENMSNLDIKKAVIVKVFPKADLAEKDETYINAMYDASIQNLEEKKDKKIDADNKTKVLGGNSKNKDSETEEKTSYDEYKENLENDWKNYKGAKK